MPRDDDLRRPVTRLCTEQTKLDRQQGRSALGFSDVRVHAVDERGDNRRPARVIVRELAIQVAAILEQPCSDVPLDLAPAKELRDSPRSLASPDLELKQSVARGGVALGEEEIVLALRVDVRDAGVVTHDLDRLTQTGGEKRVGGLCAKARCEAAGED